MRMAIFGILFLAGSALAQYPARPVTVVVGFAPGGGTDSVARIMQRTLGDNLGQPVVVDNKTGAGGNIAVDFVAKAPADGYTIVLANVGSLTVAPYTVANLPYDPMRDLAPITMGVVFPNVICVHSSVPAKTLADLIKMARDQPGTVAYGSSGINGAAHLAGELLKIMANAELVHVPYKGGAPALTALLANETPVGILTPVTALPHIKAGTIRALATTGAKRAAMMPDVPTVAESGLPGYEATNWYAYLAPAKTPAAVIDRLHRDIVKTLAAAEVRESLHKQGMEPAPSSPSELRQYMARELVTWGKVVKATGMKAE
ncbi:MAG TPA: tripartite tricarboxylate transporter substrate binding protein [Burkholderiales bacterium]